MEVREVLKVDRASSMKLTRLEEGITLGEVIENGEVEERR